MACAEVAAAKAKTTAINLIILFSYGNLQEERFLEAALQHSFYEPRPTKRKWVDVPTFYGANPVRMGPAILLWAQRPRSTWEKDREVRGKAQAHDHVLRPRHRENSARGRHDGRKKIDERRDQRRHALNAVIDAAGYRGSAFVRTTPSRDVPLPHCSASSRRVLNRKRRHSAFGYVRPIVDCVPV